MSDVDIGISPFHAGEQQFQSRVGKRDLMEKIGKRAIRPYLIDQHREFYRQLPFLVFGSVDSAGWPWASIVSGKPGFAYSSDPKFLRVDAHSTDGDPLTEAIKEGSPLGMLGIELHTRRRNRLNARVSQRDEDGFTLSVDQSFGNCPQYIQARSIEFYANSSEHRRDSVSEQFTNLDSAAREMISAADTFFVSSFVTSKERPDVEGVDVSHRGGKPGFVKVEGNTLTIPDYAGNNFFNTLGNFLLNPKAGLLFADFVSGDVILLTGSVELIGEDDPKVKALKGALRAWQFTLRHGIRLKGSLGLRMM